MLYVGSMECKAIPCLKERKVVIELEKTGKGAEEGKEGIEDCSADQVSLLLACLLLLLRWFFVYSSHQPLSLNLLTLNFTLFLLAYLLGVLVERNRERFSSE